MKLIFILYQIKVIIKEAFHIKLFYTFLGILFIFHF